MKAVLGFSLSAFDFDSKVLKFVSLRHFGPVAQGVRLLPSGNRCQYTNIRGILLLPGQQKRPLALQI